MPGTTASLSFEPSVVAAVIVVDDCRDDLAPGKGILNGVMLSIPFWVALALLVF